MIIREHPQIANALRCGYSEPLRPGPVCHKCGWQPNFGEEDSFWFDSPVYICGTCLEEELDNLPLEEKAKAFGLSRV